MISIPSLFIFENYTKNPTNNLTFHEFIYLPHELQIKILTIYPNLYIIRLNKVYSENIEIIEAFNIFCLNKPISINEIESYVNQCNRHHKYNIFALMICPYIQKTYIVTHGIESNIELWCNNGNIRNRFGGYTNIIELLNDFNLNSQNKISPCINNIRYLLLKLNVLKCIVSKRASAKLYNCEFVIKFINHYQNKIICGVSRYPIIVHDYLLCSDEYSVSMYYAVRKYVDIIEPFDECNDDIKQEMQNVLSNFFQESSN